jgi:hypothetical protein
LGQLFAHVDKVVLGLLLKVLDLLEEPLDLLPQLRLRLVTRIHHLLDFVVQTLNVGLQLLDGLIGRLKLFSQRLDFLVLIQNLLGGVGQLTCAVLELLLKQDDLLL